MNFYFYYTAPVDCAPLLERAHDSEKVLVPLQPALQSFATTVLDKECIRHVQPHHVFTCQQRGNARFSLSRGPADHKKMRQLLQHVYVATTGTRDHIALHVLHAARASARVPLTTVRFGILDNCVAAPLERVPQSSSSQQYPALARVLALHDRTAKSSTSFHMTSTRAPSDGLSRDAEDMMLRLLSLQEQRAPKKQRTINATHCAYGTRRSSSNRPPSTKTLVNKRWPSVAAQLHTLLETRPQQHTTMCREHPNRTDRHNLCMRMQPSAQALLCTAKHDCTMNALRTGRSQHERQGSRPNRHDADNHAGPIKLMPSACTHLCCSC